MNSYLIRKHIDRFWFQVLSSEHLRSTHGTNNYILIFAFKKKHKNKKIELSARKQPFGNSSEGVAWLETFRSEFRMQPWMTILLDLVSCLISDAQNTPKPTERGGNLHGFIFSSGSTGFIIEYTYTPEKFENDDFWKDFVFQISRLVFSVVSRELGWRSDSFSGLKVIPGFRVQSRWMSPLNKHHPNSRLTKKTHHCEAPARVQLCI